MSNIQPIDVHAIGLVQSEIKRQVGVYMTHQMAIESQPNTTPNTAFWCGTGNIGFDVSSIKAELTTTLASSVDTKAGVTLPIEGVVIGGTAGYKNEITNTQVLTYNLWTLDRALQTDDFKERKPKDGDLEDAPIAQVLLSLREALIKGAMKNSQGGHQGEPQPCFTDFNPEKPTADAGNTYKLGLSVTNTASGGLSVKIAVISIGSTFESKSTTGNTLTVSFVQTGLQKLQALKVAVDAECKYPNQNSPACKKAQSDFVNELAKTGVGVTVPN